MDGAIGQRRSRESVWGELVFGLNCHEEFQAILIAANDKIKRFLSLAMRILVTLMQPVIQNCRLRHCSIAVNRTFGTTGNQFSDTQND